MRLPELCLIHAFGIRLHWTRSFVEPMAWAMITALVVWLTLNQGLVVVALAGAVAVLLSTLVVRKHLRSLRAVAA